MKHLTLKCIVILLMATSLCKAQNYATLQYWSKDYKLDRQFINLLNENWSIFINGQAQMLRYYDPNDYQDIYDKIVQSLVSPDFTIIVTESNQLHWRNPVGILPGTDGNKDESKKRHARASFVLYQVVLPALNQFVQYKEYNLK